MQKTKGYINLLTISLISLFGYATGGYGATIYVANFGDGTCSLANGQSAYNTASAGDTIVFPAGNCIWSSSLTIGKPISIIGAGSGPDGTKLIASGSMTNGFFNVTGITSSYILRISGFYFEMTDWTPETAMYVHNVNMGNIRIDHNIFSQGSKPILFYNPKGLIDNNYFYNSNIAIEYSAGSEAKARDSWVSMAAGTTNALFIEDNHFIDDERYSGAYANEKIGTFNGGKLVVRYNHFDAYNFSLSPNTTFSPIMTHGSAGGGVAHGYWQIGTGARRGQSVVEIYNNLIEGNRIDFPIKVRGSANLIHNNRVNTINRGSCRFQLREEEYDVGSNWDIPRTSWPAEDQVHNTFIWNNTWNGVQMTANNIVAAPDNEKIKLNRDYFLHAPCGASDKTDAYGNTCTYGMETFTGANGASNTYPTDGNVYPTHGTMIFSPEGANAYYPYTPYRYPHPLRDGKTALGSPKNVRVIN